MKIGRRNSFVSAGWVSIELFMKEYKEYADVSKISILKSVTICYIIVI
jgi:hypothetical protein